MRERPFLESLKIFTVIFFIAGYFPAEAFTQENERAPGPRTVAFLYDGESPAHTEAVELITGEIEKLAEGKYAVKFSGESGGFDKDTTVQKLDDLLAEESVDLIVGMGFVTAHAVFAKKDLRKPVVLAEILDPGFFDAPYDGIASGRRNLTYLSTPYRARKNIDIFHEIIPFKRLHIMIDSIYLETAETVIEEQEVSGVEFVYIGYGETPEDTMVSLGEDVAGVYFIPSDIYPEEYNDKLIDLLNEAKVPTFAYAGEADVEKGILVGLVPKFYTKFARRVAINADRIFRGEDAGEIPVNFDAEFKIVINSRTARSISVSIPFSLLFDAEVLYPYESWGGVLTMNSAIEEALGNNINFRIRDEEIRIVQKEHLLRWSEYLPDVGYRLQYRINDSERAKTSAGLTPKWDLRNRFTLSQLIFSDPVITKIINSRQQVDIERLSKYSQELDITDETARTYLQYLIAKALLKVEADNLAATEHNLGMARKRNKIGVAGKEEIMRWESEVADRQSNVIRAESDAMTVRITLNQLMNRPQETPFQEEDVGLELTRYYIGGVELKKFVKNENMLRIFINFNVEKGLGYSPEIQALDISIGQQRRVKDTAFRKFFLPEASLDSYLDHQLRKKYYGVIPQNENDDWFVGMSLKYPLFEGGARGFGFDKQKAEMDRLIFKKELTEQFTELDIRKAVYRMYFSLPNIELSRKAMVSATGNYKIMEEKYSRGTASITALIDAQNEKFNRESQAVIAVYEFLQDLADFDRSVSRFYFLLTDEEKGKWLEDLEIYFANTRIEV